MTIEEDRDDRALVGAVGATAPIVVAALLVIVRDDVLNANLAMILVGVVVFVSLLGGRTAGAVAAITAALSFNFFLTEPYLTLRITDNDDLQTMFILLLVGSAVGLFAERAQASRRATQATRSELGRIRRLTDLVSQGRDPHGVVLAGQEELTTLLGLTACRFETPPYTSELARLERTGVIHYPDASTALTHRYAAGGFELPTDGVELPVFHRGNQIGRYVLSPKPGVGVSLEQRVVAVALADQVGAAQGA